VRGKTIKSGREELLVPEVSECEKNGVRFCPECTLGLDIKHTDVLILAQYIRPDGCMLPRRVTNLCKRQQKRIGTMVTMAHKAGLLTGFKPEGCKNEPTKRKNHKKFNTYFYEHTIKLPKAHRKCSDSV
jgi:small subunit ribosomal protein S18